jgi:hypothetical protein
MAATRCQTAHSGSTQAGAAVPARPRPARQRAAGRAHAAASGISPT